MTMMDMTDRQILVTALSWLQLPGQTYAMLIVLPDADIIAMAKEHNIKQKYSSECFTALVFTPAMVQKAYSFLR